MFVQHFYRLGLRIRLIRGVGSGSGPAPPPRLLISNSEQPEAFKRNEGIISTNEGLHSTLYVIILVLGACNVIIFEGTCTVHHKETNLSVCLVCSGYRL